MYDFWRALNEIARLYSLKAIPLSNIFKNKCMSIFGQVHILIYFKT